MIGLVVAIWLALNTNRSSDASNEVSEIVLTEIIDSPVHPLAKGNVAIVSARTP